MTTIWYMRKNHSPEELGILPQFINELDTRDAVSQIDTAYSRGGGWMDFEGFTLKHHADLLPSSITYPDDPPYFEIARAKLRDETILFFPHAWVVVVQLDGTFRVARID